MTFKRHIFHYCRMLIHPKVIPFIIIGTAVIFLTFLTTNNALEIVIAAMASIFIGIGINNFSALETRHKDEMIIRKKVANALQLLSLIHQKTARIEHHSANGNRELARANFDELITMLDLLRNLLLDEEHLS